MQWKHINWILFLTVGKSIAGNLRNLCQIVNAQAPSFHLQGDLCMAEICAIPTPFSFCPARLNGSERVWFPILLTCCKTDLNIFHITFCISDKTFCAIWAFWFSSMCMSLSVKGWGCRVYVGVCVCVRGVRWMLVMYGV